MLHAAEDAENSLDTFNQGCVGGVEQAPFALETLQQSMGLLHLNFRGQICCSCAAPCTRWYKASLSMPRIPIHRQQPRFLPGKVPRVPLLLGSHTPNWPAAFRAVALPASLCRQEKSNSVCKEAAASRLS